MPTIEVIRDTSILRILESICKSWKYMIVSISYIIHLLLQSFNAKKNIKRNNYRYCISVSNKFFEKFKGPRKYTFLINDKDIISIQGPSGVGKSTLLNIIALLDNFDNGEFFFENKYFFGHI